ncbi:TKL protein kinase [Salpingoeca rosetta]|uniref:TKL protein kinase n=1 Tax=Salpingoeca rosetta (strain ATCC 50818 / BSB-021) TaxID=946362 RepID=F2TVW6_SALR5|nr:TKL protein kinase [Salpingoeca rosetta]EGD72212.1 TKL protein kinase [Salpingoeca rosetta]|eukprot:XP_004998783.1 TKL protein kinase [Salpingoeca rosetta]
MAQAQGTAATMLLMKLNWSTIALLTIGVLLLGAKCTPCTGTAAVSNTAPLATLTSGKGHEADSARSPGLGWCSERTPFVGRAPETQAAASDVVDVGCKAHAAACIEAQDALLAAREAATSTGHHTSSETASASTSTADISGNTSHASLPPPHLVVLERFVHQFCTHHHNSDHDYNHSQQSNVATAATSAHPAVRVRTVTNTADTLPPTRQQQQQQQQQQKQQKHQQQEEASILIQPTPDGELNSKDVRQLFRQRRADTSTTTTAGAATQATTTTTTTTTATTTTTTTTSSTTEDAFFSRPVVCDVSRNFIFDCTFTVLTTELIFNIEGGTEPLVHPDDGRRQFVQERIIDIVQPSHVTISGRMLPADIELILSFHFPNASKVSVHGLQSSSLHLSMFNSLPPLHTIDLSHSELTEVRPTRADDDTDVFVHGPSVTTLDMSGNSLSELDHDTIAAMPNLLTLHWDNNHVRDLDDDMFADNRRISTLTLHNNRLSSVHERMFDELFNLTHLDLGYNGISLLDPHTFASNTALRLLALDNNPLTHFPAALFAQQTQLEELYAFSTQLEDLPAGLFDSTINLKTLFLYRCRITSIANGVLDALTRLQHLSFTRNRLTHVTPHMFDALTQLRQLFLMGNDIATVHEAAFTNLQRLELLALHDNAISTLHVRTLAALTALEYIDFGSNRLSSIPPALFDGSPRLRVLLLPDNKLSAFETARPLMSLEELQLHGNPLVVQPDIAQLTNLRIIRSNGHTIPRLNLLPLLTLPYLQTLEIASAPTFHDAHAEPLSVSSSIGTHLEALDVTGIVLPATFPLKLTQLQLQLKRFAAGWPGMNTDIIHLDALCKVLANNVEEFALTGTGYTHMDLCADKTFRAVFLPNNMRLESVRIHNALEQLNLFGCRSLTTLLVPRVESIDLSYTSVTSITPLCTDWGSRIFFYRGVNNPLLLAQGPELFVRCVEQSEVIDLSESAWMKRLTRMQEITSRPIVLSSQQFQDPHLYFLESRADAPTVTMQNTPVVCRTAFRHVVVQPRDDPGSHQTQLALEYRCRCASGYHQSGGLCVSNRSRTALITGLSVSFVLVLVITGAVFVWQRRGLAAAQRITRENKRKLAAMEGAWVIPFKQVTLTRRIDAGTFGEVWRATFRRTGQTVAVKVLRHAMKELDDSTIDKFRQEAQFLQLARKCENIVFFHGAGTNPDGCPFLVLDFVKYGSLEGLLGTGDAQGAPVHTSLRGSRTQKSERVQTLHSLWRLHMCGGDGLSSSSMTKVDMSAIIDVSTGDYDNMTGRSGGGSGLFATTSSNSMFSTLDGDVKEPLLPSAVSASPDDVRLRLQTITVDSRSSDAGGMSYWDLKHRLALDIAHGMAYIHKLDHFHRDLKSGNVLVSADLRGKITDFGTIHELTTGGSSATKAAGTPPYMAPEVARGEPYSAQADVFSFGVVLWELAVEKQPDLVAQELGSDINERYLTALQRLLSDGRRLRFDRSDCAGNCVPEWFQALSLRCMAGDPDERPTFAELEAAFLDHNTAAASWRLCAQADHEA